MSSIERLICACVDDEHMLTRAGRLVDRTRGATLDRLADEREKFIEELKASGRTLHHQPSSSGSWLGALRVLGLRAWNFTIGGNAGDVFSACRHSQTRTEALFEDALRDDWPGEMRGILTEQHARLRDERSLLIGLQYGV